MRRDEMSAARKARTKKESTARSVVHRVVNEAVVSYSAFYLRLCSRFNSIPLWFIRASARPLGLRAAVRFLLNAIVRTGPVGTAFGIRYRDNPAITKLQTAHRLPITGRVSFQNAIRQCH